ncbi:MAG: glutamyl-tRNA reductase, partial [Candidatus Obscuribacterales bacterium]|nr:glutamyl-tRNA reductase [Candidatus Obscuribacterales bacterium]
MTRHRLSGDYSLEYPGSSASRKHLILIGFNYHGSPIKIRERVAIPESCRCHALAALKQYPHILESALLSTCNRTEVYAVVSEIASGINELEDFFRQTQAIQGHEILKPNFKLLNEDVAVHLFRVAAGLDSMILGEGQIMSQVKAAHRSSLEAGTAGQLLDQLFKLALRCGKRVRTETNMARRAVSVSSAAVELAEQIFEGQKKKSILFIGAGKMARISAKLLLCDKSKNHSICMVNRSPERLK